MRVRSWWTAAPTTPGHPKSEPSLWTLRLRRWGPGFFASVADTLFDDGNWPVSTSSSPASTRLANLPPTVMGIPCALNASRGEPTNDASSSCLKVGAVWPAGTVAKLDSICVAPGSTPAIRGTTNVSGDAPHQWLLVGRDLEWSTASPTQTMQHSWSWMRSFSDSDSSQTASCAHCAPTGDLIAHHVTVLLAMDGLRVQLFNCPAPSANKTANLLISGALPTWTVTRMSD